MHFKARYNIISKKKIPKRDEKIDMNIIVGLGNPEPEYERTRHNMGFDTINQIARKEGISMNRTKFDAIYGIGQIQGEKIILIKPQTYMNLSGKAVRKWCDFYQVSSEKVVVIYDDMDIEKGKIKIRKKGHAGSHNGMKSLISELGTDQFPRIRIGIGRPIQEEDKINYVIGKLQEEEYDLLQQGVKLATQAIEAMISQGIDLAMNRYN